MWNAFSETLVIFEEFYPSEILKILEVVESIEFFKDDCGLQSAKLLHGIRILCEVCVEPLTDDLILEVVHLEDALHRADALFDHLEVLRKVEHSDIALDVGSRTVHSVETISDQKSTRYFLNFGAGLRVLVVLSKTISTLTQ